MADDRLTSRLMRDAQAYQKEPRTPDSYDTESISNDPVGDWAASRERLTKNAQFLVRAALEQIKAAESAKRHPEDLDYRLARAVQNAEQCEWEMGGRHYGWAWASELARRVNQRHPGLLVSGYVKVWEEEERLEEKAKAKATKAGAAGRKAQAEKKAA